MAGRREVGFKKPPPETRFKKGQSGNPKGRPKGTKNLKTDLQEELEEMVLVREGNRETQISKQRAMVKSLMAKAVKGDTRAANLLLQRIERLLEANVAAETEDLSADDHTIIEAFEARVLRRAQKAAAEGPTSHPAGAAEERPLGRETEGRK